MGITEAELFKQMEAGKVVAKDVIPLLAKEYRNAARANGAFEAASKKTRAELNRVMGELSLFKNTMFESGFGEGLSSFFKTSSDLLATLKPLSQVIGKMLKWAFIGLGAAMQIVSIPFRILSKLFGDMNDTVKEFVGGGLVLVAAGAWLIYATKVNFATKAIWNLIKASKVLMATPYVAAALLAEDFGRTVANENADTATRRLAQKMSGNENIRVGGLSMALQTSNPLIASAKVGQMLTQQAAQMYQSYQKAKVEVKIDANGLNEKQIDTQVKQTMSNAMNDIASESKG